MFTCTVFRENEMLVQIDLADFQSSDVVNVGEGKLCNVHLECGRDLLISLLRADGGWWIVSGSSDELQLNGQSLSEGILKPGAVFMIGDLSLVISAEKRNSDFCLLYRIGKKTSWLPLYSGFNLIGSAVGCDLSIEDEHIAPFGWRCEVGDGIFSLETLDADQPIRCRGSFFTQTCSVAVDELFELIPGSKAMIVRRDGIERRLKKSDPFFPGKTLWLGLVFLALLLLLGTMFLMKVNLSNELEGRNIAFTEEMVSLPKDPAEQEKFWSKVEAGWKADLEKNIYGKVFSDIDLYLAVPYLTPASREYLLRRQAEVRSERAANRLSIYARGRCKIYSIANIAPHYKMAIPGREWIRVSAGDRAYWRAIRERLLEQRKMLEGGGRARVAKIGKQLDEVLAQVDILCHFSDENQKMYTAWQKGDFAAVRQQLGANAQFAGFLKLFPGYGVFAKRLDVQCAVLQLEQQLSSPELTGRYGRELETELMLLLKNIRQEFAATDEFPVDGLEKRLLTCQGLLQKFLHFEQEWDRYRKNAGNSELAVALQEALVLKSDRSFTGNRQLKEQLSELEQTFIARVTDLKKPIAERIALLTSVADRFGNKEPRYAQTTAALRQESETICEKLYEQCRLQSPHRIALLKQLVADSMPDSNFRCWAELQLQGESVSLR